MFSFILFLPPRADCNASVYGVPALPSRQTMRDRLIAFHKECVCVCVCVIQAQQVNERERVVSLKLQKMISAIT